jgi:thiamine-phosphate pyrophosphorylase
MVPWLNQLRVYLVTDRRQTNGRPLIDVVEQALQGGVRAVQLRERDLDTRSLLHLAHGLRVLTHRYGALLLVNDRIDIALASGADGIHLPAESFGVKDARTLGPDLLIGVSTHRPDEVAAAEAAGADFVVFGPVFDTPSKRPFGPPAGLEALAEAALGARLPVLAIGGITGERVRDVRESGAAGVAVIRAVLAADDPTAASRALTDAIGSGF